MPDNADVLCTWHSSPFLNDLLHRLAAIDVHCLADHEAGSHAIAH
jgi:hypothetical protein